MSNEELKPCKHCGGKALFKESEHPAYGCETCKIECGVCGISTSEIVFSHFYDNINNIKNQLTKTWNDGLPSWVSVEDRLPDEECEIVVSYTLPQGFSWEDSRLAEFAIVIITKRKLVVTGYCNPLKIDYEDITHWQPIDPIPTIEDK